MPPPKLNKTWHAKNRMPPKATVQQRIAWHLAHRKHCGCRPIPAKLLQIMSSTLPNEGKKTLRVPFVPQGQLQAAPAPSGGYNDGDWLKGRR